MHSFKCIAKVKGPEMKRELNIRMVRDAGTTLRAFNNTRNPDIDFSGCIRER